MKEVFKYIYNKYKKYIIIGGSGLILLVIGILSWTLVFSKYQIFHKEERNFLNAVKRYYEYHSSFLPKDKESRDMTLQDLYDKGMIDDLYVPKSRKLCDTNSWVRVYKNEDGEYEYITYLKCGRYSSKVDHVGPQIVLNGDGVTYVSLGTSYLEEGVKSVTDNKDKNISVDKVTIDSSSVNTSKIGTYNVTYTVKDSKYNKTVVNRQVVVTKGFSETIRNNTSSDGYYKGLSNNYVLFSGLLWKIVKINSDNTIKLTTADGVTYLRANYEHYKDSDINKWLNSIFLNSLYSKNYIIKSDYCVGNIKSMNDYEDYCSEKVNAKVGLIDINEYGLTMSASISSISSRGFMMGNKIGSDKYSNNISSEGTNVRILSSVRPTITVASSLHILSGDGSYEKPYKLNDYDYAEKGSKLNTRIVGEYFIYSGLSFKIMKVNKDGSVKAIMTNPWGVQPHDSKLKIDTSNLNEWSFDTSDSNSYGYIINNEYLDYINTKYLLENTYTIPTNDSNLSYKKYKTSKVKAYLSLPMTYDLFSASDLTSDNTNSLLIYADSSTNNELLFMVNGANGLMFETGIHDYPSYSFRCIITIDGNLIVKSGKGTINSPYKLR